MHQPIITSLTPYHWMNLPTGLPSAAILGIGPVRFKLLLDYFHEDVAAAWKADSKELAQAGLDARTIDGFLKQRATSKPQQELEKLERLRFGS